MSDEPPFISDDDRCHCCNGRGCEACDFRVLVMGIVGALPWRVGRQVGRTIYDANDELIGVMDTRPLAATVVAAVNAEERRLALAVIEAARAVVAEWTVPGDGGRPTLRRDRLIAALTAYEDQRTDVDYT